MITFRRLYQYLVCFIALQAAAQALGGLLGDVVSWAFNVNPPDGFTVTLELSILIVATPIFLGHWLWVLYLARRDPAERASALYHLYLYATQSMFVGAMVWALGVGVFALASFMFAPTVLGYTLADALEGLAVGVITAALMGGLWVYHLWLSNRKDLPQSSGPRVLYHLYILSWEAIGTALTAWGGYLVLAAAMDGLAGHGLAQLPLGLGLLVAGLPLWLFHGLHRARARSLAAPVGHALRWVLAAGFSAAGALIVLFSLADVITAILVWIAGRPRTDPPYALAAVSVGLGLWAYHEWVVRRLALPSFRPLRWLYALAFSGLSLLFVISGGVAGFQWLFSGLRPAGAAEFASSAGLLLPALAVWAFHQWVVWQTSRALGLGQAEAGSFRTEGRFLQRLYLYSFSGLGVAFATLGLIGLQMALFTGLRGQLALRDALAWLLVGGPVWLFHWAWVGRLFAAGLPDERRSDLRKLYLYLIIFAAVNTVIVTVGLTLNGLFRALLRVPTEGLLGSSVAVILGALALWVYHALVLRSDIARAAESSLQGALQRLYAYLVATFGLAAFVFGVAGVLTALITWLSAGLQANVDLRGQFAAALAALIAGLPVWFFAWWPAQRAAQQTGPAGVAARRSGLRRLYLYGFALAAVLVTLVSAITVVYQILNGLFRLGGGGNVLANIALAAGYAFIGLVVWLYHAWVLRQDGRHAAADKRVAADQQATEQAAAKAVNVAQWAGIAVAVVDDGDGRFALAALAALRRELPTLRLLPVGLTPAAVAALAAEQPAGQPAVAVAPAERTVFAAPAVEAPVPEALALARLIVAPWTAAARDPIASSRLPVVIVPLPGRGLFWTGIRPEDVATIAVDPGPELVYMVKVALTRLMDHGTQPLKRKPPKPALPPAPEPLPSLAAEQSAPTAPEPLPPTAPPNGDPPELTNSPSPTTS